MTDRPTLALLIPAYNAAAYLPRLLASAAAQTQPFDEVWVYDDGSVDDTASTAAAMGAQVIVGRNNVGQSIGKTILAKRATSDWLHFHDADDELMPNFVMLARRWMEHGRADVVLFDYQERDQITGRVIAHRRFDRMDLARDPRSYAIREQINPFCGLYRRNAYLRADCNDEDRRVLYNEDVAMHIALAFAGLSFDAEHEIAIINHRRQDSFSQANQLKCIQAQFEVLRKTAARPGADRYATEIASKLWKAAGVLGSFLDWERADAATRLARKLAPPYVEGSAAFRALARVSPPVALRTRERLIRLLRPRLRRGYPSRRPMSAAGPS
jgi:glycosyltransferase involved in cell wall biosynthesis